MVFREFLTHGRTTCKTIFTIDCREFRPPRGSAYLNRPSDLQGQNRAPAALMDLPRSRLAIYRPMAFCAPPSDGLKRYPHGRETMSQVVIEGYVAVEAREERGA